RLAGIAAIEADLPRFMRAFTDAAECEALRRDFADQVTALIARGADILIPAGGLPMLLFSSAQPFLIGKVPVLEGIAVVLKAAEMAVTLHRFTGISASRAGLYAKAPAGAIEDFLGPTVVI